MPQHPTLTGIVLKAIYRGLHMITKASILFQVVDDLVTFLKTINYILVVFEVFVVLNGRITPRINGR